MRNSTSTNRNNQGLGTLDQVFRVLVCILLLPLPVPTVHSHDAIESSAELTQHLNLRHGGDTAEPIALSELHWHFELPCRGNDVDDHESEHSAPVPSEYVAGSIGGNIVLASSIDFLVIDGLNCDSALLPQSTSVRPTQTHFLQARVAAALQRNAHSCVMRC